MRQHRTAPDITKGYLTRRMAIEYSVPLVTDIKCAKLLVKVSISLKYHNVMVVDRPSIVGHIWNQKGVVKKT